MRSAVLRMSLLILFVQCLLLTSCSLGTVSSNLLPPSPISGIPEGELPAVPGSTALPDSTAASGPAADPESADLPLAGKTFSIMAASISTYEGYLPEGYGAYYPKEDVDRPEYTWWKQLEQKTGMRLLKNASWGGSRISGAYENISGWVGCSPKRIVDLMDTSTGTIIKPDILLLAQGANDMQANIPLGEYYSGKPASPDDVENNFADAYNTAIAWIRNAMPETWIICCTYLPMTYPETGIPYMNDFGLTMDDYNEMVRTIALDHGLTLIDMKDCGLTSENAKEYTIDGVHPNRKGMELISDYLAAQLNRMEYPGQQENQ